MDPVTLAVGTAVAGTAVKTVGALKQGAAEAKAATYNAAVARQNATAARRQAEQEAAQVERSNRMREGDIRAAAGNAGVMASGSVLDVLADVVAQGELERQNTIYQGEMQARGYNQTAYMETRRAKTAKTASYFNAAGALLSGASDAYTMYREG